jgi:hypothetical protein
MNKAEHRHFAKDVDGLLSGQLVEPTSEGEAYQADLKVAALLSRTRFVPRTDFKARLRSRLQYSELKNQEVRKMSFQSLRSKLRPVMLMVVGAILMLGVLFAVSPDVRAAAMSFVARFVEVDSPWALLPEGDPSTVATGDGETLVITSGQNTKHVVSGELPEPQGLPKDAKQALIPLEDAQAESSFEIRVPATLPDGYEFLGVMSQPKLPAALPGIGIDLPDDLPDLESPKMALLIFGDEEGQILSLSQMYAPDREHGAVNVPLPSGVGSVQDVTVKGQSAQYVAGMWTEDGWSTEGYYQLRWQEEDIVYTLASSELELKNLLPMAESLK